MARTNVDAVQTLLADNYDGSTDLQQFVDSATLMVDRVQTLAAAKGKSLTTGELEMIERYLAAHHYTTADPLFTQKTTAGASGGHPKVNQSEERYLDRAITIDYSGVLKQLTHRQTTGFLWLGKPASQQIPYSDRS